ATISSERALPLYETSSNPARAERDQKSSRECRILFPGSFDKRGSWGYRRRTNGENEVAIMASLPLLPDFESRPRLIGIARIAADGESLREGHNVEYFTLGARSLLTRVVSGRKLPFTWSINPYRGCEFACKYCYARYTHEFMELRDGVDFERKIFVKQQAAALLRSELKKVKRGEEIAIGTATDPYQPAERRFEITRAILEELAQHSGLEIGIVTKSNLVTRDAEILRRLSEHNRVFVNMTVTTVDVELARKLEPRAPRPDLRLEAVRQLNLAGVDAGVICAPVLPEITDHARDLEALVKAASEAGAKYVFANPLFLKPCSAAVFLPFVEENFPALAEFYRKRYSDRAFLPKGYGERLSQLMAALRRRYGIGDKHARSSRKAHIEVAQMEMF
ncbi:MAG: radical SAM protein, partial [Terriglobales bacterium]